VTGRVIFGCAISDLVEELAVFDPRDGLVQESFDAAADYVLDGFFGEETI